jgi:phosphoglucosamine mutase
MIEPALTAGFISVGMDVILVGPMPTPAVALLTRSLRADIGVMISASHNPHYDNGIKLFAPDGYKLSDAVEAEIESRIANGIRDGLAAPAGLGRAKRLEDAQGRYIEFVKNTFPKDRNLGGLKIVVDCANGAAYKVVPTVLWELGAEVVALGVEPDGFNINQDCGSTAPERMCAEVVAQGADLGIALDGDADRLVMCDEKGRLLDGDQLMALVAGYWARSARLKGGGVVATIMSNLAFERHLKRAGLVLVRTQVGDRYVVDHMRQHGFNLGGEQSGHIILSDYSTTGDGLIAALQALAVLVGQNRPASEAARAFEPLPQVHRKVPLSSGRPLSDAAVRKAIRAAEARLGASGRIVIRESGTEPVIRVMAEGEDERLIREIADELVHAIARSAA